MAASPQHQGTSVRTHTRRVAAGLLLGCVFAAPAFAQDAATPQPGASAAVEASATPAPAPAKPAPARKRGAFGEAMSRLTQALREASEQPAAATTATTAPAAPATSAQPAAARVEQGALAVESPP
jgi:hypothetical protein